MEQKVLFVTTDGQHIYNEIDYVYVYDMGLNSTYCTMAKNIVTEYIKSDKIKVFKNEKNRDGFITARGKVKQLTTTVIEKTTPSIPFEYQYSFAELVDRLTIVQLKESISGSDQFKDEIKAIVSDIQKHLDSKPITAEAIRAALVLAMVNQYIFVNEDDVREDFDNENTDKLQLLDRIIKTHKQNSLRAIAKKVIQQTRGERIDEKLNYSAAENNPVWKVSF